MPWFWSQCLFNICVWANVLCLGVLILTTRWALWRHKSGPVCTVHSPGKWCHVHSVTVNLRTPETMVPQAMNNWCRWGKKCVHICACAHTCVFVHTVSCNHVCHVYCLSTHGRHLSPFILLTGGLDIIACLELWDIFFTQWHQQCKTRAWVHGISFQPSLLLCLISSIYK